MTVLEIGRLYCRLGFNAADLIVADSAEPKTIAKLRNGWRPTELTVDDFERYPRLAIGFNVIGAAKGRDSVSSGLGTLLEKELFITEDSVNMWNEINHYVYETDKDDNPTNQPTDKFNHLIDPLRYAHDEINTPRAGAPSSV